MDDSTCLPYYSNGTDWVPIGTGGTGASATFDSLVVNDLTVNNNLLIPNYPGVSAAPDPSTLSKGFIMMDDVTCQPYFTDGTDWVPIGTGTLSTVFTDQSLRGSGTTGSPIGITQVGASGNGATAGDILIYRSQGTTGFWDVSPPPAGLPTNFYLEGSFDPEIAGDVNAGTGVYVSRLGRFTANGRLVHFQLEMEWLNLIDGPSGNMIVIGLPYVSSTVPNDHSSVSIVIRNIETPGYVNKEEINAFIEPGKTHITLGFNNVPPYNRLPLSASGNIIISGWYIRDGVAFGDGSGTGNPDDVTTPPDTFITIAPPGVSDSVNINFSYIGLGGTITKYEGRLDPAENVATPADCFASSEELPGYGCTFAANPNEAATGPAFMEAWRGLTAAQQRFNIELPSPEILEAIEFENYHNSGAETNTGVVNWVLFGSNVPSALTDPTYVGGPGFTGLTIIRNGSLVQHPASDTSEPQRFPISVTESYSIYAIMLANNYGGTAMGLRNVKLLAESADPWTDLGLATSIIIPGVEFPVPPLSGGPHTFQVRAFNSFGPDPTPAEHDWFVDSDTPTTLIEAPLAGQAFDAENVLLRLRGEDITSAVTSFNYRVYPIPGAPPGYAFIGASGNVQWCATTNIHDRRYRL
jgi:hypothetical protein